MKWRVQVDVTSEADANFFAGILQRDRGCFGIETDGVFVIPIDEDTGWVDPEPESDV